MERPLRCFGQFRREFEHLGRALLYADGTVEAHVRVLREVFGGKASRRVTGLAGRTVGWTATRPQPRLKALVALLESDGLVRKLVARAAPRLLPLADLPARMRPLAEVQVGLASTGELADWLRVEAEQLLWFADLRDLNGRARVGLWRHYSWHVLVKPYGAVRLVEAPWQRLKAMQRQILEEVLAPVPLRPAVHGFCKGRSIMTFAAPHSGWEAVLRMDLEDFFPTISGARVQALFRTLGYPEAVADMLGGLCTTTTPKRVWRQIGCEVSAAELQRVQVLYGRPHLPQGAPTSPAVANLCAFRLDCRLGGLAKAAEANYTRYADDLAFSGDAGFARGAGRFAARVAAIVAEEGFAVNFRKTRLMRQSVRQHLAGLTVNVRPHVSRQELDRLEAILTNCVRFGPEGQNREGLANFRRHLEGRVAFAGMVGGGRVARLRALLELIVWERERSAAL